MSVSVNQRVTGSVEAIKDTKFRVCLTGRNGAVAALIITALLYGSFIVVHLATYDFDASIFVTPGALFCRPPRLPAKLRVRSLIGYDGQFYYRLALDPLTHRQIDYGIRLDIPAYRQQRIVYPALAGALALWHAEWVPWTMILINYLAICGLGLSAGLFALALGKHPLWGLLIPFYPGLLLSLDRDLTEVLAISLVVAALYLLHRGRLLSGACVMALGVLTRETAVLVAVGLLAQWVLRMFRKKAFWSEGACLSIPLALLAIWEVWIFVNWGRLGFLNARAVGPPAVAMLELIKQAILSANQQPLLLSEVVLLSGAILSSARTLSGSAVNLGIKIAWVGYLALALIMSGHVWLEGDWAFLRAVTELFVLSALILVGSRNLTPVRLLLPLTLVTWGAVAWRSLLTP